MESPRVLEPFQPSEPHTWEDYVERFEFFAVAQGITDASKRRATFLSYCGPETFKLAKALLAPAKLSETSLKDILACLTSHLAPTETKMARRMEFHKRQQHAGESVSAFLAELRKLAQHCGFQNLEETLLDRFIGGLSSKKARRRIVAKEEVTLASALKEATATENYEREELDASRKATIKCTDVCCQETIAAIVFAWPVYNSALSLFKGNEGQDDIHISDIQRNKERVTIACACLLGCRDIREF
ncbi:uncharacterized protein LOC132591206 [Zootoca vivipara]|uniref:uncharacterized protein LOC132591206 n=1 Tax=Zootoca vivipara TaxID=8524 RepID=UPI00293BBD5E|nr:uncharacterized protein LOC132591206 [Zootoca vivipara]